jgi:hypothetical protein
LKYFFTLIFLTVFLLISCANNENPQADLILEEAHKASMEGDYGLASTLLEEIINKYPNTSAASIAAEEYDTFKNFAQRAKEEKTRELVDKVKQVAKAVESYKYKKGKLPKNLDELIPKYLPSRVTDIWDNPILYKQLKGGYIIASFGKDGIPGGTGNNKDIFFQNGKIVSSLGLN